MEIFVPFLSVVVFYIGILIGKSFRFTYLFYDEFLNQYNQEQEFKKHIHPECFDDDGNLIDEEFIYMDVEEDD